MAGRDLWRWGLRGAAPGCIHVTAISSDAAAQAQPHRTWVVAFSIPTSTLPMVRPANCTVCTCRGGWPWPARRRTDMVKAHGQRRAESPDTDRRCAQDFGQEQEGNRKVGRNMGISGLRERESTSSTLDKKTATVGLLRAVDSVHSPQDRPTVGVCRSCRPSAYWTLDVAGCNTPQTALQLSEMMRYAIGDTRTVVWFGS
jgi:hypothetical protein